MNSPSVLARSPMTQQLVGIISVDPINLTSVGFTRQKDKVFIDLRYPVGAIHVIPCVGEQWILRKVGMNWALDRKLPKNTNIQLNVADNPVQGLVQIGSNGVGSGPLVLDASVVNINAPITIDSDTLYRDVAGVLQFSVDNGTTWNPVASSSGTESEGSSGDSVIGEMPNGPINGSNDIFTTKSEFAAHTTRVYRNGLREQFSTSYTETEPDTITFSSPPLTTDVIEVDYCELGDAGSSVFGEIPTGVKNGANTTFTTIENFQLETTRVYRNGLREKLDSTYTESQPNTIVFSNAPLTTDIIEIDYNVAVST